LRTWSTVNSSSPNNLQLLLLRKANGKAKAKRQREARKEANVIVFVNAIKLATLAVL